MKHIKLFENWAEENAKLPWWLDKKFRFPTGKSIYNKSIQRMIREDNFLILYNYNHELELTIGADTDYQHAVNMKSFSDYDFWKEEYDSLYINQYDISKKYRLVDCIGMPNVTQFIKIQDTNVKSLRGLEFIELEESFLIGNVLIENLKYCPTAQDYELINIPLLSYYGIKSNDILNFTSTLCGFKTYTIEGYHDDNLPTLEQLNDFKFNANVFSHFMFESTITRYSNDIQFNPWTQVYEDPNNVENDSFLFFPFYINSENFRTKAKEYIKNLDAGNLDRSDLW